MQEPEQGFKRVATGIAVKQPHDTVAHHTPLSPSSHELYLNIREEVPARRMAGRVPIKTSSRCVLFIIPTSGLNSRLPRNPPASLRTTAVLQVVDYRSHNIIPDTDGPFSSMFRANTGSIFTVLNLPMDGPKPSAHLIQKSREICDYASATITFTFWHVAYKTEYWNQLHGAQSFRGAHIRSVNNPNSICKHMCKFIRN
jgi:hypothetical protein